MNVDGSMFDVLIVGPNSVKQLLARIDGLRIFKEVPQQSILGWT
jgi:hypothetical protein